MSNLASVIMEGVSAASSSNLGSNYDFSQNAVSESSYMTSACASLFSDVMEAEMSWMVADVVGAAQVIHESRSGVDVSNGYIASVQEGVLKSGIEKLKNAFHKFIAKIREFYKRVTEWFKAMFSGSKEFVTRYGAMLKTKSQKVKDFHYTGFKYNLSGGDARVTGDCNKIQSKITTWITQYNVGLTMNSVEFYEALSKSIKFNAKGFDASSKPSSSEVVDGILEELKASDVSEYQKDLVELYQGDTDTKSDIKDFEGTGINAMLDFLKDANDKIALFNKQLKNYEDQVGKVISNLDKYTSKDNDEDAGNKVSHASYISSCISAILNLYKVPCNVQISMYKTISKEWLGVLKKFYNFKGNKGAYAADMQSASDPDMIDPAALGALESDTPDDILDDGKDSGSDSGSDDSKGSEGGDAATESALASILETANAYRF